MRIAFFGLPMAAVLLARDGHEVAWAGVLVEKGLRRLEKHMAPGRVERMPELGRAEVVARIRAARPDLLVSWFWVKPVPPTVLAIAPAVGVHPSLLPRYRGPDPYFWAIDAGDEVTGVTAHLLEPEYDTGPVLARREVRIDPAWDAWRLARVLDRPSLAILRETVRAYAEGRPPKPVRQDDALATAAPAPTEEDLAIRWTWPAERIARRVRAAAPYPGAWTEIGDELVILTRVRPTPDFPRALEPGEAAVRRDGVAIVRAADAALELLAGRAEDDETPLGASDLARIVANARD
ncbi:MAG TPA: formyltransferase family protein [Polyangiaceae bacterium]